ncbi:MAG: hypothetical protein H0T79_07085 [Deltaproteobacteria bacterium]|nr:hypothetical protein [Deltaproteobacteria bacterium]
MCCFSVPGIPASLLRRLFSPPLRVSATNIFARLVTPGVQALAYGMTLAATTELAMILPLPVVPRSGDDALQFVNLEAHATLFADLAALFVEPQRKGGFRLQAKRATLRVHAVGSFIASYVPSRADFARVDPRFRLPDATWDAFPDYADYGFAVFQLAPGKTTVHPMAFTFPTRTPDRLFFPTVHIHDGRVTRTARFDHALYYQAAVEPSARSQSDAVSWGTPSRSYAGLVDPARQVRRRVIRGRRANVDTWI